MGRALPPQQDARERELPPQGPPWRAGAPATLRVLILALLWRGSLSQPPGFTLKVPQSVSVQEGLSVLVPCTFTYPAWYDTYSPSAQLYRYWYKDPADVGYDLPAASSDSSQGVSQETQGRFRLAKNPAHGDCSLQISDARRTDAGRYFLRVEKGILKYSYRSSTDGTDLMLMISVPPLERTLKITVSRANRSDPQLFQDPSTLVANGSQLWAQEGDSLRFLCSVASSPPAALGWVRGGRAIEGTCPMGENQLRLELPNVTAEDGGLYGCWARNKESSAQGTFQLLVEYPPGPPSITGTLTRNGHPEPDAWGAESDIVSLETQEGDSLSLSCEAGSRAETTLSWAKGNESLSPGKGGAGHLELLNLSPGDAGEYRCWAKNPFGSASRALHVHVQTLERTLQITVSRANRSDPQLFQDPGTLVANGSQLSAWEGESLRFLCSVASSPPAALGWVRGGRAIEGTRPTGENQLWLELPNVTAEDGGLYGCWAQNKKSSAQGTFLLLIESPTGGLTWAFIEISCKLVFAVTGFFLAYYLTLLYYRRTPCCSRGSRRKARPGARESTVPESSV